MDHSEDLTETYKQTTVHIIETLQPLIDEGQYLHSISFSMALERILLMLTTDLTYDDPGIFENIIIEQAQCRDMHEAFNMWLNNQIIFIFSATTNKRFVNFDNFITHNFIMYLICLEKYSRSYICRPIEDTFGQLSETTLALRQVANEVHSALPVFSRIFCQLR